MTAKDVANGMIYLYGVFAIAIIILKIAGPVLWGWVWVTVPLWIPAAAIVLAFAAIGFMAVLLHKKQQELINELEKEE
jgi:hypothetical protein